MLMFCVIRQRCSFLCSGPFVSLCGHHGSGDHLQEACSGTIIKSSAVLVQVGKEKGLWVIFDSAWSVLHVWWWNDLKDERPTKTDRCRESGRRDRKRTRQRQKTGDTDTIRKLLFLHYYFNTHFPTTVSSFLLLFILSLLHVSIISFYLSVSLAFYCSDTQTNEPWNIRELQCARCVHMCVGGRLFTSKCVYIFPLALSLSGLLATLEGSPAVLDQTSVVQETIWHTGSQIGCWKLWICWLLHSWSAKETGCFIESSARNLTSKFTKFNRKAENVHFTFCYPWIRAFPECFPVNGHQSNSYIRAGRTSSKHFSNWRSSNISIQSGNMLGKSMKLCFILWVQWFSHNFLSSKQRTSFGSDCSSKCSLKRTAVDHLFLGTSSKMWNSKHVCRIISLFCIFSEHK